MIRQLEARDREEVLSLLRVTDNFTEAELAVAEEVIDVVLGQPNQRDYFAFVEDLDQRPDAQVGGFLVIGPTPATVGTWDLYWIAAHPSLQGKGVAQALHHCAESFVRSRRGYWLLAETSSQPGYARARGFYLKQQYVELARIADYYRLSDDMILYGKRL